MTIQQWLFSFKGRIGRRDFWIWIGLWFAGMLALFSLAGKNLLDIQTAAFCLVYCCGRPPPSWSNVCMTGDVPARGRC